MGDSLCSRELGIVDGNRRVAGGMHCPAEPEKPRINAINSKSKRSGESIGGRGFGLGVRGLKSQDLMRIVKEKKP